MFKFEKSKIPKNPGVYLFRDEFENIIYIGKAKNLQNRISSYFSNKNSHPAKTLVLVKNIKKIDFIIVDNELESLLLENKLIKKYKPKYNINLKDNKTYAYIKITNISENSNSTPNPLQKNIKKIPKILTTRIIKDDGIYFGPFTDSNLRRELIDLIVEIFGLITPKTFSSKSQLNYQIGLSPAKNISKININNYLKNVIRAKNFLEGKNINKIIKQLKEEMEIASKNNNFEIALYKKNQIENILKIKDKQKVDLIKNFNQDIIAFSNLDGICLILLLNINKGTILKKEEFRFDYSLDLYEEFLKIYYSKNTVPKEIIVSEQFWKNEAEKQILENYFSKKKGSKVILLNPKRGEKKSLIELAKKNAVESLKNNILVSIKNKLNLPKIPKIIECFDMSNLGHQFQVGAMTRWVNQKEDKSGYRKFEIKSFKNKQDDFAAIREVIYRRYLAIKTGKEIEGKFPDLIIIDGGKGQLSSAIYSLKELNLKIPIISIKKGAKRDKNDIFILGKLNPIILDNNSSEMIFLRKVRDSAHNLAINYNRKKRDIDFKNQIKNI